MIWGKEAKPKAASWDIYRSVLASIWKSMYGCGIESETQQTFLAHPLTRRGQANGSEAKRRHAFRAAGFGREAGKGLVVFVDAVPVPFRLWYAAINRHLHSTHSTSKHITRRWWTESRSDSSGIYSSSGCRQLWGCGMLGAWYLESLWTLSISLYRYVHIFIDCVCFLL